MASLAAELVRAPNASRLRNSTGMTSRKLAEPALVAAEPEALLAAVGNMKNPASRAGSKLHAVSVRYLFNWANLKPEIGVISAWLAGSFKLMPAWPKTAKGPSAPHFTVAGV